jgi:hypothetical protein
MMKGEKEEALNLHGFVRFCKFIEVSGRKKAALGGPGTRTNQAPV